MLFADILQRCRRCTHEHLWGSIIIGCLPCHPFWRNCLESQVGRAYQAPSKKSKPGLPTQQNKKHAQVHLPTSSQLTCIKCISSFLQAKLFETDVVVSQSSLFAFCGKLLNHSILAGCIKHKTAPSSHLHVMMGCYLMDCDHDDRFVPIIL